MRHYLSSVVVLQALLVGEGLKAVVGQLDVLVPIDLQDVPPLFVYRQAPHHVPPVEGELHDALHAQRPTSQVWLQNIVC